jgi:hypothetical protein
MAAVLSSTLHYKYTFALLGVFQLCVDYDDYSFFHWSYRRLTKIESRDLAFFVFDLDYTKALGNY